jgi:hypothetical protein
MVISTGTAADWYAGQYVLELERIVTKGNKSWNWREKVYKLICTGTGANCCTG